MGSSIRPIVSHVSKDMTCNEDFFNLIVSAYAAIAADELNIMAPLKQKQSILLHLVSSLAM